MLVPAAAALSGRRAGVTKTPRSSRFGGKSYKMVGRNGFSR